MANLTQNIALATAAQTFNDLEDINLQTATLLETGLGNIAQQSATLTGVNNNLIQGSLSNGDAFSITGTNLLGYPSTMQSFSYTNAAGISLLATGSLTVQDDTGTATGSFDTLTVEDNSQGQLTSYTYQGQFSATSLQATSLAISTADYQLLIEGQFDLSNDSPTGQASTITITKEGHSNTLTDINVDIDTILSADNGDALLQSLLSGNDLITGSNNADYLQGYAGDDVINGQDGHDTAMFNISHADVQSIQLQSSGATIITSSLGIDTLLNIERIQFTDYQSSLGTYLNNNADLVEVSTSPSAASLTNEAKAKGFDHYIGPVEYLEFQKLGDHQNEAVLGTDGNDFINLLGGDDAADGGLGHDILDGGTGSNFLTGGQGGNDTFYLDGRGGEITWSTITDFSAGDSVNIWGWVEGTSQLLHTESSAGATGYEGVTYHYDLDDDGTIDTSLTFTGLSESDLQTSVHTIEDLGYLLIV